MYWIMRWSKHYQMWFRWDMSPCKTRAKAESRLVWLKARLLGRVWDIREEK